MSTKPKKSVKPVTKPTSLITFLLDRSSSMLSCKAATIEAFNGYIEGLQREKKADISFTFLQFDTQSLDKVCVAIPVATAVPLTDKTYLPRGGTPLIDAAVKTINAVAEALTKRDDKPKVVIAIQTDGEENSSREHTWEELRGLIAAKQALGWEFNFMGAGIDAYEQGARMGISTANTVAYDSADLASTRAAFMAGAVNASDFSAGRSLNTQYTASQKAASGDRWQKPDLTAMPVLQTFVAPAVVVPTHTVHTASVKLDLSVPTAAPALAASSAPPKKRGPIADFSLADNA